MAKCKYNFSKEELERLYEEHGSYSKAAKALGVSKTTFMQQYRKSQGNCIVCNSVLPEGHNQFTCEDCLEKNRVPDKPNTKQCKECGTTITRNKKQSKLSWSKKEDCEDCLNRKYKESLRKTKKRYRAKYNEAIRLSPVTKKYQKAYRESEKGRTKRRISNAKRRAAKITTASPDIDNYILSLYEDDNKCCPYCKSVDNLSIDHIKPLSRGGTHTEDNVELVCLDCNIQKGNKTKDEYMIFLKELKVEV